MIPLMIVNNRITVILRYVLILLPAGVYFWLLDGPLILKLCLHLFKSPKRAANVNVPRLVVLGPERW
jgi:hypothetical protein